MNICVIPVFERPEYLTICLEQIKKADRHKELVYLFACDSGFNPRNIEVIKKSGLSYSIFQTQKRNYTITKQSFNVLNSLCQMALPEYRAELIFYIEDDIFIGKDFFTYNIDLFKQNPDLQVSICSRNNNTNFETTNDPDAYYFSTNGDYQGLGSCFRAEFLNRMIQPHVNDNYLFNPFGYVQKVFPDSKIGAEFCEQDGLIRRVIEKENLKVAFPHVPRCYHAGIYGYHRPNRIQHLSFDRKLEKLRSICFSHSEMKHYGIASSVTGHHDSEPCDLNTSHTKLKLTPCRVI